MTTKTKKTKKQFSRKAMGIPHRPRAPVFSVPKPRQPEFIRDVRIWSDNPEMQEVFSHLFFRLQSIGATIVGTCPEPTRPLNPKIERALNDFIEISKEQGYRGPVEIGERRR
jgi:hypothetical protein